MHCPRCGSTVERGRTLCPTCKEPLGAAIALAAAQAAAEARPGEMASQPRTLQMPAIKLPMAPRATLASPTAEALHDQPEGSVTIKLDLAPASPRVQSFEDEPSVTLRLDVIADSVAADSVAADSEEATRKTAPLPTSSVPRKTAASPTMGSAASPARESPQSAQPSKTPPPRKSPTRPPAPHAAPPDRPLREGDALCDGRFTLTQIGPRTRFGVLCAVVDATDGANRSAFVLRANEGSTAEALALGPAIAALAHPNLAQTLAVASDAGRLVVVTERIEGGHLGEHLARRPPGQTPIPVRNALSSVVPLAAAMAYAQQTTVHGAFDLDAVYMQPNGRLKIVGFGAGFVLARPNHASAPEAVRAANEDDARGLCRLLHALLTGRPFERGGPLTANLRPDIGPGLGALLARGLAGPPTTVADLLRGLHDAQKNAADIAAQPGSPQQSADANTGERWMIVKGHLDYGPYSVAQLRREVAEGKLTPDGLVKNVATGARGPVNNFAALASVVSAYAEFVRAREASAGEAKRLRDARHYKTWRAMRTGLVLLGVAGGLTWFLLSRMMSTPEITRSFEGVVSESLPPRQEEPVRARVSVPKTSAGEEANDVERGETATKRRRRNGQGQSSAGGSAGGSANPTNATASAVALGSSPPRAAAKAPEPEGPLAPDEAPAQTELDFADTSDPASATLRDAAKASVRKSSGVLRPCFDREARRPSFRGRFKVAFMVSNQGSAYAVRVSGSDSPPSLMRCIRGALGSKSFPKFSGTPLEVEYPFSISN